MVATFIGNPSATIICYSHTNVSEETDPIAFNKELSSLVRSTPKHNVLIIGGDMNAQIGNLWFMYHKFCLHVICGLCTTNSAYTTSQTEMGNFKQILH